MVRIDWRYIKERGDYKDDNSKNRGFSLVEVDTNMISRRCWRSSMTA